MYKQSRFGSQNRSFCSDWYKQYTWLEYSIKSNAAFCYACRMFADKLDDEVWTKKGFSNWQKVSVCFELFLTILLRKYNLGIY